MDNFQIVTAQNVEIDQNIANLADRILAYIIDWLVMGSYAVITGIMLMTANLGIENLWIYSVVIGLPIFLYHLLFETFNNGRSIGKMVLRIRVVKVDGSKPSFSNFLLRWLLRIIDISLCSGSIAIMTYLINGKGQRLGDIAATTTVVSEKQQMPAFDTLMMTLPEGYTPKYPEVTVFSDREMQTIKNVYQKELQKKNYKVISALAEKSSKVMNVKPEESPISFLKIIIWDYSYYTQEN